MFYIGADPDTHSTAIAIIDDIAVCAVYVIKCKGKTERAASLAMSEEIRKWLAAEVLPPAEEVAGWTVEGQELYLQGKGRTKNPRSILFLAPVSGALIHGFQTRWPLSWGQFPSPQAWKGEVPKVIHHGRICTKLQWPHRLVKGQDGYAIPEPVPPDVLGASRLNPGDWKHALDAIGLAMFTRDKCMRRLVLDEAKKTKRKK